MEIKIRNAKDEICQTGAININPLKIDLGKCVLCGECERKCSSKSIIFSNFYKLSVDRREKLIIDSKTNNESFLNNAISVRKELKKIFGRSLKIRQISAGDCNGCEMELNACSNVNFDMGRFGIDIVASLRHADCILITGPISKNMSQALEDVYLSIPDPKIVTLAGSCAISGGIFADSNSLNRDFLKKYKIDLYIPGCSVHPLTVINGILDLINKK